MRVHESNRFDILAEEGIRNILGIQKSVPLSPVAMARGLRVTFFPLSSPSQRVTRFCARLKQAFLDCSVNVLEYEDALDKERPGKIREGIVIIAPGELRTGELPVDHVSNLRTSTIVGIVDGPCPADLAMSSQQKLNSIVSMLSWNIVQVVIYVDEPSWTICTMNGAVIKCGYEGDFGREVYLTLVPKLAAPVVPPHSGDFDLREGALDLTSPHYAPYVKDFVESGVYWARTGLLLFHTSMESLSFRNSFYKRVAAAYLDNRSGMSYGFLARQLPTAVRPALTLQEAESKFGKVGGNGSGMFSFQGIPHALVRVNGDAFVAEVPDVRVLTTRSGCDKSNIDPERDLTLMGLSSGKVFFETPKGTSARVDCRPSYDTLVILSHAVGNALIAALQARIAPDSSFVRILMSNGMALAHWHGRIDSSVVPRGYFVHGESNPPVSCSTYQAAIYALTGKLSTFVRSLHQRIEYTGDVHVEPHHGTNVTGPTLLELARWALSHIQVLAGAQT